MKTDDIHVLTLVILTMVIPHSTATHIQRCLWFFSLSAGPCLLPLPPPSFQNNSMHANQQAAVCYDIPLQTRFPATRRKPSVTHHRFHSQRSIRNVTAFPNTYIIPTFLSSIFPLNIFVPFTALPTTLPTTLPMVQSACVEY